MNNPIILKNSKILEFHLKYPNINPEKLYLNFIKILEESGILNQNYSVDNLLEKYNNDNKTILSLLTENVNIFNDKFNNLKNDMENLKLTLNSINPSIVSKLYELKESFISQIKEINTINNTSILDNFINSLKTILPTIQNNQINILFDNFKKELETLNYNSPLLLTNITKSIESNYSLLIKSIQEQVAGNINQTETRLANHIDIIKQISNKNLQLQEHSNIELSQYINQYKNSSLKGALSENMLFTLLTNNYTTAEIINTSSFTSQGDFIMKQSDKPQILFENKNYSSNVPKEEIDKFFRDIDNVKSHGIFISQNSGIVGKNNLQVDIHNGYILIFLHNVKYEFDKINTAVQIIDILSLKLQNLNSSNISLPVDVLNDINTELNNFASQKDKLMFYFKDFHKKFNDTLQQLKFPSLELFLSQYFANLNKNKITCEICMLYSADNNRSMARHKTKCIQMQKIDNSDKK